jgi:hypothetical protein
MFSLPAMIASNRRTSQPCQSSERTTLSLDQLESRDLWAVYTWWGLPPNPQPPQQPPPTPTWTTPGVWQVNGGRSAPNQYPQSGDSVIFNNLSTQNSVDNVAGLQLASLVITAGYSTAVQGMPQPSITLNQSLSVLSGSMSTITNVATDATVTVQRLLVVAILRSDEMDRLPGILVQWPAQEA